MRKGTAEVGGELTKSGGPIGSSDKGRTLEVVLGQLGCAGTIQIARRAQAHADTTSLNSNPRHINNPPRHRTHSRARPHHTQYALHKSHSGSPAPGLKQPLELVEGEDAALSNVVQVGSGKSNVFDVMPFLEVGEALRDEGLISGVLDPVRCRFFGHSHGRDVNEKRKQRIILCQGLSLACLSKAADRTVPRSQ